MLDGEDVTEGAADIGQERRALLGGGDQEAGIEGGQEGVCDIAVGFVDGGDAGQAQLLGEAPLQGAEEALDAAPGLGRVGGNVRDAELAERPANLSKALLVDLAAGLGGEEIVAAAVGIEGA